MKPLRTLVAAFGAAISLFWIATHLPGLPVKTGEWLFWGGLIGGLPFLLLWFGTAAGLRAVPFFEGAAFLHGGYLLWTLSASDAAKALRTGSPGWQQAGLALLLAAATGLALIGLAKWWRKKTWQENAPYSLALLFLFLVCLYEPSRGFPLYFWKYAADIAVLALFGWLTLTTFYGEPSGIKENPKPWVPFLWIAAFALWGSQSVAFLREASLHHWSFYVGPLTSVRQGGWLLHDVPSQYGFLSILLPSVLPLAPFAAFHHVSALFLFVQAVLVFVLLLNLPLRRHRQLWAGLMTFCLVYWLPGDRNELGALSYPNTGAYRFLWTLALGLLLTFRAPGVRFTFARTSAVAVVYVLGCLWAWESAVFGTFVLGFSLLADLISYARNPQLKISRIALGMPYLACAALLAAALLGVQAYYQTFLGAGPDWAAYTEFSQSYRSTFAVATIAPYGAINCLLVLFLVQAALLLHQLRSGTTASLRFFSLYGVTGALFTYFIVRSHSVNIYTLVAIWLPCLAALIGAFYKEDEWDRTVLGLFTAACALFFSVSLSNFPFTTLGNGVRSLAYSFGVGPAPDSPWRKKPVKVWNSARNHALPWVNLATDRLEIPTLSIPEFPFASVVPLYPSEQFCILTPERRAIYLERAFERRMPRRFELLAVKGSQAPCLLQVLAHLDVYYYVVNYAELPPDLSLYTLEARR